MFPGLKESLLKKIDELIKVKSKLMNDNNKALETQLSQYEIQKLTPMMDENIDYFVLDFDTFVNIGKLAFINDVHYHFQKGKSITDNGFVTPETIYKKKKSTGGRRRKSRRPKTKRRRSNRRAKRSYRRR
jgi:hypothetical protein